MQKAWSGMKTLAVIQPKVVMFKYAYNKYQITDIFDN